MISPPAFLLLVNSRAGRRARESAAAARRALGRGVDVAFVTDVDEVRARLRDCGAQVVPVATGGDGTVNLVARALRAEGMTSRPMGVLPAGTGNAFAFSIGTGHLADAIEALRRRTVLEVDVMTTDHPALPLALVSISVGFEGRLLDEVARRRARALPGFLAPRLFTKALRPSRGVSLLCEGRHLLSRDESFYSAGVYNMPCYFYGRVMIGESNPTDGEAHARVYPTAGLYWRSLLLGRAETHPDVRTARLRRARIESDGPVQADGEAVPAGGFEITVERAGLRVLVPRDPRAMA